MKLYDNKTIGGILLVAGTSIGAGMLALPITTGMGGFVGSFTLFILCFLYMLVTLMLLLEANLYEENLESNIISMAKRRLGPIGLIVSWASFLLLLYSVAAAYMSAGGSLLAKLYAGDMVSETQAQWGAFIFAAIFGAVVYFGAWLVDYINRVLMLGLIVTYVSLVVFVSPHVRLENLMEGQPKYLLAAVPVIVLSFTSHIIVPSLRIYLQNSIPKLLRILIIGSLVPLVFYILWEFVILGVLPNEGEFGLIAIAKGHHPVAALTHAIHQVSGQAWISTIVGSFSFFALVTSFVAVILSLMDFLSDGLQIKKDAIGKLKLILMTLIPPFLFAIYFPSGFVLAISYAGVFVAILYGILPSLMIWKARYKEKIDIKFKVPGGKPLIVLTIIGAILVILFQVASTLHWLPEL